MRLPHPDACKAEAFARGGIPKQTAILRKCFGLTSPSSPAPPSSASTAIIAIVASAAIVGERRDHRSAASAATLSSLRASAHIGAIVDYQWVSMLGATGRSPQR